MKLLAIIGLVLTCLIAVSEAHSYGKNGKNIAQKYGPSNYNGLRSGKIGVGYGVGYKVPNNYQGYHGKLGPYQYRFGRYRFGNHRYSRYGQRYGLGYGKYGRNYLGYGYNKGRNGKVYYDEEEQDASHYYPRKYGRYQYGKYGRRFGFGKYRYGRYGQQYGLGYGRYGQNYLRYGHKNGYKGRIYYDEEEQDASLYYPKKYGRYQYGKFGRRYGIGKYRYGKYGRRYGFSKYGHGKYAGRYGSQYGQLSRKYQGYGYGKGKVYYDGQEQDS